MADISENFEENERNRRIQEEFQRISVFFEDLDENKKSIVLPLIQNAAFMRITLDDLQEIISREGPIEGYQNGANQFGLKQSAALQSYNTLVKNFAAVIKTLFGLLPPMKRPELRLNFIPEKTEEQLAEERRQDEERIHRIESEIRRAAEMQRKQREKEGRLK